MNQDAVALIGGGYCLCLVVGVAMRYVEDLWKEWRAKRSASRK